MKYLPLNLNTTFTNLSVDTTSRVLDEAYIVLQNFTELSEVLLSEEEYRTNNTDFDDDFPMVQLDAVEAAGFDIKYDNLQLFSDGKCSFNDSVQRRLTHALHYLKLAEKMIEQISGPFIPMSSEQVRKLRELVDRVLGELSYFVFYQFNLDQTQDNIERGEEIEVNIALKSFLDYNSMTVEFLVEKVQGILKAHKPKFTIFEAFPKLEEEFYNIAGAYIRDFDTLSEYVTVDIVKDVISGKSDVEAIIKELEAKIASGEG